MIDIKPGDYIDLEGLSRDELRIVFEAFPPHETLSIERCIDGFGEWSNYMTMDGETSFFFPGGDACREIKLLDLIPTGPVWSGGGSKCIVEAENGLYIEDMQPFLEKPSRAICSFANCLGIGITVLQLDDGFCACFNSNMVKPYVSPDDKRREALIEIADRYISDKEKSKDLVDELDALGVWLK